MVTVYQEPTNLDDRDFLVELKAKSPAERVTDIFKLDEFGSFHPVLRLVAEQAAAGVLMSTAMGYIYQLIRVDKSLRVQENMSHTTKQPKTVVTQTFRPKNVPLERPPIQQAPPSRLKPKARPILQKPQINHMAAIRWSPVGGIACGVFFLSWNTINMYRGKDSDISEALMAGGVTGVVGGIANIRRGLLILPFSTAMGLLAGTMVGVYQRFAMKWSLLDYYVVIKQESLQNARNISVNI